MSRQNAVAPGFTASGPAEDAFEVTVHDTNVMTTIPRAVYVGVTGDVKVTTLQGTDVTFKNFPAGLCLPVRVLRVFDTGTTATDIVGLV